MNPTLSVKPTLTETEYLKLYKTILNIITLYKEATTDKDGWVRWYKETLKVVPHTFLFTEDYEEFVAKIERTYDLFELAYVYCKLVNKKSYIKDNHSLSRAERLYVLDRIRRLSEGQFVEMKTLIKTNLEGGLN